MTRAPARVRVDPRADLPARIALLERELSALRQQLDAQFIMAIATVAGSRAFSASELWWHARAISHELRDVFGQAGIHSAGQLGKRLARIGHRRQTPRGLSLERIGVDHHVGAIWIVRVDSPTDPCASMRAGV